MAKKDRPAIENPLANIGLDDIVRNITASGNIAGVDKKTLTKNRTRPKTRANPGEAAGNSSRTISPNIPVSMSRALLSGYPRMSKKSWR